MRITLGSKSRFEPGSIMETVMDYATGTYTGTVRATQIIGSWLYTNTIRPFGNHVLGLNLLPGMRPKVENGTIKVAAVGFGRTGTVRFREYMVHGIYIVCAAERKKLNFRCILWNICFDCFVPILQQICHQRRLKVFGDFGIRRIGISNITHDSYVCV